MPEMNRRQFMVLAGAGAAATVIPTWGTIASDEQIVTLDIGRNHGFFLGDIISIEGTAASPTSKILGVAVEINDDQMKVLTNPNHVFEANA